MLSLKFKLDRIKRNVIFQYKTIALCKVKHYYEEMPNKNQKFQITPPKYFKKCQIKTKNNIHRS